MSYTTHEWVDGETITAAKLNNIEEGIGEASQQGGGGSMVIGYTWDGQGTITLDKTAQEIIDAMTSGVACLAVFDLEDFGTWGWNTVAAIIDEIYWYDYGYSFVMGGYSYLANTLNDYPTCYIGD